MKKVLIGLTVFIGITAIFAFIFRGQIGMIAMMAFMAPSLTFEEDERPKAPDYADAYYWAAMANKDDASDITPNGVEAHIQGEAAVDVFFVHPTTYVSSEHWNQPLDSEATNERTDDWVMRDQASIFNGCCNVYAPRYRQATLFSFQDLEGDGGRALDLAYQDIKEAFEYFLEAFNQDKPFIIAGHSQGSFHVDRLLREEIAGTQLENMLVAAYPVGFSIDGSNGIRICESAEQTNCQVSWNANTADAGIVLGKPGDICVNPISWTTDDQIMIAGENKGSISFANGNNLDQSIVGAQCKNGTLLVEETKSERYSIMPFGPGNYHYYDYSFYHMDVRDNAILRAKSFLQDHSENTLMDTLLLETGN